MNTMNHKGYTARIEFDEPDNIFVGRVLGLRSIISFHGETVADLRYEFEVAIEDFLNDCKEQGVKPEKPASGKSLNQWATEVLQSAAHA
jgi:predicted HicB family RNase H-like nuclease